MVKTYFYAAVILLFYWVQLFKKNILDPVTGFQLFGILRYAMLLLTAVALSHSGLTLSQIGLYETMLIVSGMLSFYYVGAITTRLLSSNKEDKGRNYKIAFTVMLVISVFIALILFLFKEAFASLLHITQVAHIKYFALYIVLNTPGFLLEYFFLLEKKIKALLAYSLIYGVMYMGFVTFMAFNNPQIESIFLGLIFVALVRFVILTILIFKKSECKYTLNDVLKYCSSSLPLLLSLLLSGSADYIDSFLTTVYFGQEQLAIFKYGAKELPLSLLLANALSNAMVPVFSNSSDFSKTVHELKTRVTKLIRIIFPVTILLMLTASWIYPLVFSERFSDSAFIFCIYLLLVCSRVLMPQTILLAKGCYNQIAVISALELLINIAASIFLIKFFGLYGIALGTVIAFMSEKLILLYFVKRKFQIIVSDLIPLTEYSLFLILLIGSFFTIWFCK